jgi:hypothetical protein
MSSFLRWQSFQHYFLCYRDPGFSLDISRMKFPDNFFEKMQPNIDKATHQGPARRGTGRRSIFAGRFGFMKMQPTWQPERLAYNDFHLTGNGSNVVGQGPRLQIW